MKGNKIHFNAKRNDETKTEAGTQAADAEGEAQQKGEESYHREDHDRVKEEEMSRFAVRASIVAVAVYLMLCYVSTLIWHINIWNQTYYLLFELCVCFCITAQGKYHCKYIKWTAYAILIQDCIMCSDVMFGWMPVSLFMVVPTTIIGAGLLTTLTLAIRHYVKVKRLKKIWRIE